MGREITIRLAKASIALEGYTNAVLTTGHALFLFYGNQTTSRQAVGRDLRRENELEHQQD
jgi:hypothetical protein